MNQNWLSVGPSWSHSSLAISTSFSACDTSRTKKVSKIQLKVGTQI